ncbi:MAG: hypothetical protein ACW99Q_27075, partial [Candidatus Kariarchaeaceae archaeon]
MSTKKIVSFIGLLIFVQILFLGVIPITNAADNIPDSYYQNLDINGTYIYNVTSFGNPVDWYNFTPGDSLEGKWNTNTGGQILINFTGFYDKDSNDWGNIFGDPIPWLDIEIFEYNAGSLTSNFTLNNRSNSEVARALTFGFNSFQPGFLIPNHNLTNIKDLAVNQSDPGGVFDIVGDVVVDETTNFFYIGFDQIGAGQQTKLIYDKETGILVWAKTSIFGYLLEIESINFTIFDTPSFKYDIIQFGGANSWYNFNNSFEGEWETNTGGQIIVNFTGLHDKDPNDWGNIFDDPIAWFDIEIIENKSGILSTNFTLYNRSSSEIAWGLTLGYNNFQPGFLINIMENITAVKKFALQEAGGFVSGKVTTEETELALKITFKQEGGGQLTSMIFEKRTGLLLWVNTSFGSYILEMSIGGYSPRANAEEVI